MLDAEVGFRRDRHPGAAGASLRLRQQAGDPTPARRQGLRLSRRQGQADYGPRHPQAHPRARHPAGLDQRLDLRERQWPHPGHRARRQGAQAIPLPCGLSRGARGSEVRAHAPVRQGAADNSRHRGRAYEPARPVAAEGACDRRAPSGSDADPGRQRRIRQGEPKLRPDDSRGRTTSRSTARKSASSSPARAASNGRWRCATGGWRGSCAPARSCRGRISCNISKRTRRFGPSLPATSTTTCGRSPATTSPPRTSAPGQAPC